MSQPRPTRSDLAAAYGRSVPDLIAPELKILFCGINPSLYSAATGHHFARPGNRFWPALYRAGFTRRLLKPWEEKLLLEEGVGITNLVARATATAAELTNDELRSARQRLGRKVRRFRPLLCCRGGNRRVSRRVRSTSRHHRAATRAARHRRCLGAAESQRPQRQPSAARALGGVQASSNIRGPVSSPAPLKEFPSTGAAS